MASNFTEHFKLNQWERSDKVLMEDFNEDNAKIDGAIQAEAVARAAADQELSQVFNQALALKADSTTVSSLSSTVSGHTSTLAKKGNCRIYTTSYVGSGTYGASNPNCLQFSSKPAVVFLAGPTGAQGVLIQGHSNTRIPETSRGGGYLHLTWSGNSVSWYDPVCAENQMNIANSTYLVVALLPL